MRLLANPVFDILDASGTLALEQDSRRLRPQAHREITALHGGPQEGARAGNAKPATGEDLVEADTLLARAVEIVVERKSRLLARRQIILADRMNLARRVADMH